MLSRSPCPVTLSIGIVTITKPQSVGPADWEDPGRRGGGGDRNSSHMELPCPRNPRLLQRNLTAQRYTRFWPQQTARELNGWMEVDEWAGGPGGHLWEAAGAY